jgi:hypothetical protein
MSTNKSRKTKIRIGVLIAQCVAFILFYLVSFFGNPLFFLILVIGSVVVLSTGTIYTFVSQQGTDDKMKGTKQFVSKEKALEKRRKLVKEEEPSDFIEDYLDGMPSIQKYVDSDKSYEDTPLLENFIFAELSTKELDKINRLGLSDTEKNQFINELLYFTQKERKNLIDSIFENLYKTDEELIYIPPMSLVEEPKAITVYAISLIESKEKRKTVNIESTEFISEVKDKLAAMFDYKLDDFLLSTGGLIMDESAQIKNYNIKVGDEIVLIPSRIPKK